MTAPARTTADPAAWLELRHRIQAQMTTQRHADAERHSEARAAVRTIHLHAACAGRCAQRMTADAERWQTFTQMSRTDQAADLMGQPATLPGPILAAAVSAD